MLANPGRLGPPRTAAAVAISVPDETFERASRRAIDLGMSRSEFFARAARHYLDELDIQSLTGRIDDALEHLGPPDDSTTDAVSAGQRPLAGADDEW
ncbi:MAG: ribbon-helix-helix domain-containing protein [Nocardioides sp.]